MHLSSSTVPYLLWLGATATAAMPAVQGRAPAPDATDAWVTVGEDGRPKTVTPVVTTIDGTPTVISAAPNAVTATVFTTTNQGDVRTSTGTVPNPTPTATGGAGAFPVCENKEGDNAPFCLPVVGAELNPGHTYYITWDPTFFPSSNTTVKITGSYFNSTNGEATTQAFSSGSLAAAWSFYAWTIDASILKDQPREGVNISLNIASLTPGTTMTPYKGPVVKVAKPGKYMQEKAKPPTGPALYIGLPTVFGFVLLVVIGTCWWNRNHRKIDVGSVMGRGRRGYGVGKSRRQRVFAAMGKRERKEQGIRLMERDVNGDEAGEGVYRDEVEGQARHRVNTRVPESEDFEFGGRPRRDSDALGSLAGSPTEERFEGSRKDGKGNAFRDELSRQERERF